MATEGKLKPNISGILSKRQRGLKNGNGDMKSLKFQRRRVLLMPTRIEYYGTVKNTSETEPNGTFPIERITIVEEIPQPVFKKKFCFQVPM